MSETDPLTPAEIRTLARLFAIPTTCCGTLAIPLWWAHPRTSAQKRAAAIRAWLLVVRNEIALEPTPGLGALRCPSCGQTVVLASWTPPPAPIEALMTVEEWEEGERKHPHQPDYARTARSYLHACLEPAAR